jgi:hypothetical protein
MRAAVRGWSGEDDGDVGGDLLDRTEKAREDLLRVDVLGAVQGEEGVRRETPRFARSAGARRIGRAQEGCRSSCSRRIRCARPRIPSATRLSRASRLVVKRYVDEVIAEAGG